MVTWIAFVDFLRRSILVALLYLFLEIVGPSGGQDLVISLWGLFHGF